MEHWSNFVLQIIVWVFRVYWYASSSCTCTAQPVQRCAVMPNFHSASDFVTDVLPFLPTLRVMLAWY